MTASDKHPTQDSVGDVTGQTLRLELPPEGLQLEQGGVLPEVEVAYECYGPRSDSGDNVVFICHALTGDAHVAGRHPEDEGAVGWWDDMIGPGKGIDTRHYHVICANVLGGCKGTTGPSSINPETGQPYGSAFPAISVADIVDVHVRLLNQLGISRLATVIGGSFGGMQALDWAIRYPDMIQQAICIASSASLSAQALAFDLVARDVITADPEWAGGDYYGSDKRPERGLSQARKLGHITYLSSDMLQQKFGRERRDADSPHSHDTLADRPFKTDFEIEGYLDHQGRKFVKRFDANSYLHITRAMDAFDLSEQYGSLNDAFGPVNAKVLVVGLSADWLFPVAQSRELAHALLSTGKAVSYCELHAPHGHDAFLVDIAYLSEAIHAFLPWVSDTSGSDNDSPDERRSRRSVPLPPASRKKEFAFVEQMIQPGTRILDLGCGNGDLLALLERQRQATGVGIDIDIDQVINVIDRGFNVFQQDIDGGLAMIPDHQYDYAVLNETLQVVRRPRELLQEMLRVADKGIVSFPNFGNLTHRLQLLFSGHMPVGGALPFTWYDTPNIHHLTLSDFMRLCEMDGIDVLSKVCIPSGPLGRLLMRVGLANLGADRVLVKIARRST